MNESIKAPAYPLEIVDVLFHDGHVEQMTFERLQRLPYGYHDISRYRDAHRTFELGFRKSND